MKKILHYYTYAQKSGGPLTYLMFISNSNLKQKFQFEMLFQEVPFSKMTISKAKSIINKIKSFNPDVLHVHGLQGEGFLGVLLGKLASVKKILVTVHGIQRDAQDVKILKRLLMTLIFEPLTLFLTTNFYCVSQSLIKRFPMNLFYKKSFGQIDNCVFHETSSKFLVDKKIFGIDNLIISVVGRVTIDKGMNIIKDVILHLNKKNISFLIIGDGNYRSKMEFKLKEYINKSVFFIGFSNFVSSYLSISDIYLSASLHENFSIALMEAMNLGLPVIATNVGDNTRLVTDHHNGFLVETNDYKTIIEKISYFYENRNLISKFGKNSKSRIIEQFNEEKFLSKIANVYDNIIKNYE